MDKEDRVVKMDASEEMVDEEVDEKGEEEDEGEEERELGESEWS